MHLAASATTHVDRTSESDALLASIVAEVVSSDPVCQPLLWASAPLMIRQLRRRWLQLSSDKLQSSTPDIVYAPRRSFLETEQLH